jgi:hypothetical protein
MSKLSNSEQTSGNIQTEVFTSKDNGYQSKKFFFTYHLEQDEQFEQIFTRLEPLKELCDKFVWGEEYGKSGNTRHIQGAIILKCKMRWKTIETNFFGKATYGTKLKNWQASLIYCTKECNTIHTNANIPKPLKTLACEKHMYNYQINLCKILETEPDDRTIFWYCGKNGGEGKTTFCKYIYRNFKNVIILGGKSADMKNGIIEYQKCNGILPEIILINLPRSFNSDYLSYTGIEEVKDMFFYSGKYEGGMVDGNSPHLIIFSNELPDTSKMTKTRWNIKEIIPVKNNFYAKTSEG